MRNKHKVPTKKWRKWSARSKVAFNQIYELMLKNQGLICPSKLKVPPKEWQVVCWNVAFLIADGVSASDTVEIG